MSSNPNNLNASFDFESTSVGENMSGKLFLENQDTHASPEYVVSMVTNNYFQPFKKVFPRLNPGAKASISFTLTTYGSLTVEDIPRSVDFELLLNNSRVRLFSCKLSMSKFAGTLRNLTANNWRVPLKLVLFGVQSSGKSAFVNSIVKMLRNDISKYPASSGSGYGADTIQLQDYTISDYFFSLIDTWGWTLNNYMNGEIDKIIDGTAPRGLSMDNNGNFGNGEKIGMADCIICVVNYEILHNPNQTWIQKMSEMLEKAKRKSVPVIFLITRLDEANQALATNPNLKSSELADIKQKVKQTFGVGEDRIDYVVNYTTTQGLMNFELDRRIFSVLYNALSKAAGTRQNKSTSTGPVMC